MKLLTTEAVLTALCQHCDSHIEICEGLAPVMYKRYAMRILESERLLPTIIAAERKDDE